MIRYREGRASDVKMVVNNWRDSYRMSPYAGIISMARWSDIMDTEIRHILARPGVELHVAYNPEADPSTKLDAHGWIAVERGFRVRSRAFTGGKWRKRWEVSDKPLVHYVYVKDLYRKRGIARELFRRADVDPTRPFLYTCRTHLSGKLSRRAPGGKFDPFISRFPKNDNRSQENEGDTNRTHPIREPDTERAGV